MTKKVLIVGGGIVGCLTALELVQRGCQVTLVERNEVASQTSGESSWAGAGILFPLLPWMYGDAVNQLTMTGASLYPAICKRLLTETGIDPEYIQSGLLLLPEFDQQAALDWCAAYSIQAQTAPSSFYAGSGLASSGNKAGLWLPSIGQVRPPNVLKALRVALLQHGVKLVERTQLKPLEHVAQLNRWETTTGELLEADQFVVTSGAWSFELLKSTASGLNIKPMRGQILLYQQPEKKLEHIVYANGFYLVPRQDGLLLAGSTLEDVGFDNTTTEEVRLELETKAQAIYPVLKDAPVLKHWSGLRPGTPENLPTICAHPTIENLYLNTGHFRYGLTMAPASAQLVVALMSGEKPQIDATPYAC
jgi:glycine oxidase